MVAKTLAGIVQYNPKKETVAPRPVEIPSTQKTPVISTEYVTKVGQYVYTPYGTVAPPIGTHIVKLAGQSYAMSPAAYEELMNLLQGNQ